MNRCPLFYTVVWRKKLYNRNITLSNQNKIVKQLKITLQKRPVKKEICFVFCIFTICEKQEGTYMINSFLLFCTYSLIYFCQFIMLFTRTSKFTIYFLINYCVLFLCWCQKFFCSAVNNAQKYYYTTSYYVTFLHNTVYCTMIFQFFCPLAPKNFGVRLNWLRLRIRVLSYCSTFQNYKHKQNLTLLSVFNCWTS
jgi:hypothetical protein